MPSQQEFEQRVARAMATMLRLLRNMFILGFLLMAAGLVGYIFFSHHTKTFYYLMLSGLALWLVIIIFYGYNVCYELTVNGNDSYNRPFNICYTICLVIVLGSAISISLALVSEYKRDNKVKFDMTEARLTQFNFSSNNISSALEYNLTVRVTVGPNQKKHGVNYDTLRAWASYQGINFTSLSLPPFYLGGKNNHTRNSSKVVLQPLVFQGRQDLLILPPDGWKRYRLDEAAGRFSIDVTLSYSGSRGQHQMEGVTMVTLNELALPNAASGWVEGREKNPIRKDIVAISVAGCCFLCFLCCCCWLCAVKDGRSDLGGYFTFTCFCLVAPLIILPVYVPELIKSVKKMDHVEFNVSDATLAQFNLSSSSSSSPTLIFNFSVSITVGPNHKKTGVYCDKVQTSVYYQGQTLTSLVLPPFYLQARQRNGARTVILRPVFEGQQVMTVLAGGDGLNKFRRETAANRYSIVVTLSYRRIRTDDYDYDYDYNYISSAANQTLTKATRHRSFDLKVPLLSSGGAVSAANVYGFTSQHGFNLLLVLVIYGLIFFPVNF